MALSGKQLEEGSVGLSKFKQDVQDEMNKVSNVDFTTGIQDEYVLTYDEVSDTWSPKSSNLLPNTLVVNPDAPEQVVGRIYLSLEDAVTYCNTNASSTNILFIVITKSVDLVSPITLTNPFFSIRGIGLFESYINVQSTGTIPGTSAITIQYTTVQTNSPIGNLNIVGNSTLETTSATIGLNVAGNGVIYINNLRLQSFHTCVCFNNVESLTQVIFVRGSISIRDGGQWGLIVENSQASIDNIAFVESAINIEIREGAVVTFFNGSIDGFTEGATGIGIKVIGSTISDPVVTLNSLTLSSLNIGVQSQGGRVVANNCTFDEQTLITAIQYDTTSEVRVLNTTINLAQIKYNAFPIVSGNLYNRQSQEDTFSVFDKLTVGIPSSGSESFFGEGNTYSTALMYSFNGTTYSNVLPNVVEFDDANTYAFPNNSANTALYISNIFVQKFFGLKLILSTPAVLGTGDIVFEYWDGAAWSECNHMITKSTDDYLSYANTKFVTTPAGTYDIRFDFRIGADWAVNDPISSGSNRYWLRMRISSAITTSPVFDFIQIIPNSTKMSVDGFLQYYGTGRPMALIPVSAASFAGKSIDLPADQDIYVSDSLFKGGSQNSFRDNKTDSVGLSISTPFEIDTSCPLILRILYTTVTNPTTTGNIRFRVDYGFVNYNDLNLYASTTGAPTTGPNQVTVNTTATISTGQQRKVRDIQVELELPEIVSQRIVGGQPEVGDIIFVQISRDGGAALDTFNGDIQVIETEFIMTKSRSGGHLKIETL